MPWADLPLKLTLQILLDVRTSKFGIILSLWNLHLVLPVSRKWLAGNLNGRETQIIKFRKYVFLWRSLLEYTSVRPFL